MSRHSYSLVAEPSGSSYVALLEAGFAHSSFCHLVIPPFVRGSPSERELQSVVGVSPVSIEQVTKWPGTELYAGRTAVLMRFPCEAKLLEKLVRCTDHLYGWEAPALPEDLGFTRADGSVWLGTITHEREGFMSLSLEEHSALLSRHPILVPVVAGTPDFSDTKNDGWA